MSMGQPLHLRAYAKVNLGLDVVRRREDGYHEVRMIMQSIGLYDLLTMEKNNSGEIRLSANLPYLPVNEKNLVYRAVAAIKKDYGIGEGITVNIQKRIPVAAGMAGGSTDAAAAFIGMNQMFGLGITQEKLMEYGVALGADIPFCIMRGTALSEGIGERLTPLPSLPDCWLLVVKPSFSMSTKFVYEHLQLDASTRHPDIDGMVEALQAGDLTGITDRMENVLELVAQEHYPDVLKIKEKMKKMGALNALMSGSGSTVFGVFLSRNAATKASRVFYADPHVRQTAVVRPFRKSVRRKNVEKGGDRL